MEQAANPDNDDLPRLRASLTEAVQALLAGAEEPKDRFIHKFAEAQFASHALSKALLRAVSQVTMELGEAYAVEANTLPASTSFLCAALAEFRRRKGINF